MLTFIEVVRSRFHVATRYVERFSKNLEPQDIFFEKFPDESIVGKYQFQTDKIIITTLGIRFNFNNSIGFIPYADTSSVEINTDPEYKNKVEALQIIKKSGERFDLLVRGGNGRLRDAWTMYSFLKHVLNAYIKRQSGAESS